MRILIVEDDKDLNRQLEEACLETGYVVDKAFDGEEGHFLGDTEPYDAVILDITIPGGMGGKEVIGRLRDYDPEVKAIVSSGYSNDEVMAEYEAHGFVGMLNKPFKIAALSQVLKKVLHSAVAPRTA